ncbi:hypothetical protein HK100_008996 [Physocladia obscura]|uniref:Exonuclease domain-containing protein n=1 Tax=Physocladia obscura TaxID=109957 RepID=A0AAD5TAS3_9FUNG|nr:hypothetical protein HK100_008996 [Physocladia obscura]
MQTQQYRYLAVLDFEATCIDTGTIQPQEIIEFPVVVLDTELGGAVVSEFHQYVRPQHHTRLSAFCTRLTGIEQHTVDAADGFEAVWAAFLRFVADRRLTELNTLFVTCGDWDLKTMLPAQLRLLVSPDAGTPEATSPLVLRRWCNIKTAVNKHANVSLKGMPSLLAHFNLPLKGRHHSGIDDSRNIAAIAQKLLEEGYVFASTVGPKPSREKFSAQTASQQPQKQRQHNAPPINQKLLKNLPRKSPPPPDCGPIIDIGANLSHRPFDESTLPDVLRRAKTANVSHIIITGTNLKASKDAVAICRKYNANFDANHPYPRLYCTVGVHPHDASKALQSPHIVDELETLIISSKDVVVAVGECGLDFDRNFSTPKDQEDMFLKQCRLSQKLEMPLFLHERSAHERFMEIVKIVNSETAVIGSKNLFGVVHCYTGETELHLSACLAAGFHIGITGWVTDERPGRGAGLASIVNKVPLDRLMIETDAPFLKPRNVKPAPPGCEPELLGYVAVKLAELYGVDAKVATETTENLRSKAVSRNSAGGQLIKHTIRMNTGVQSASKDGEQARTGAKVE